MLTVIQLREMSWLKFRAASTLADGGDYDTARDNVGLAIELMLKARVCVDLRIAGFPESKAEFAGLGHLKTHDFEKLLGHTSIGSGSKISHPNAWATCLQWSPDTKYSPMGTATKTSAMTLLYAAEAIIKEVNDAPELAAHVAANTDNAYVKLWALEREVAIEKGDFMLYAVVHREGAYEGSADLIVSAPWIDPQSRDGADYLAQRAAAALGPADVGYLSGVIALAKDHPVVRGLTATMTFRHSQMKVARGTFNNVTLDRGFIVTAADPEKIARKQARLESMERKPEQTN